VTDGGRGRHDPVYDSGVRWVRVSKGLYLVGIGTFLLLTTQGLLPPGFWTEAAAYWPVLLVALGIRLVFERSPMPALVLLGPILVLGTLMYVAKRGPARAEGEGEWVPIRAERSATLAGWTFEGRLALASLDVTSRRLPRGLLAVGRAIDAGRHSVRVAEDAASGRVRVTNSLSDRTFLIVPGVRRARGELGVTTALPVALDLDLALTTARLDLPMSPVTRLSFDGAFNELTLRLGEPADDVRLDLEGAFNQVVLEVPATTQVRVRREGFMNIVDQRREVQGARGADGGPGYRLRLEGAFNRVVIRSG